MTKGKPPRSWHEQPCVSGARQAQVGFWAQPAAQPQAGGALPLASQ